MKKISNFYKGDAYEKSFKNLGFIAFVGAVYRMRRVCAYAREHKRGYCICGDFTGFNADGTSAHVWDKTDDLELYPYFTANHYTVTINGSEYDAEFGSDMPELNEEDVLSKTGYTFDGYFFEPEEGEAVKYYNSDGTSAIIMDRDGDVELVPHFTINQYTITFNSNGGSETDAITQDYNSAVSAPTDPTKTGYNFEGWFADDGLTEAYAFSTMPAEDITLYAKWTARTTTVILGDTKITATYDAEMPTITVPTQIGYTFQGYFDQENGKGVKYYDADGASARAWDKTEDEIELYPYWTINSYKVEISETVGTKSVYTALSPIATSGNESGTEYVHGTKVYGFAVIAGGYSAPHNWILVQGVANTGGAIYYIGETTVFGADYDFSDDYETEGIPNKYVVVFDGERTEEVVFGQTLNDLTAEQIPTKAGYTFDGYSANGNKYFDNEGKCIRAWDIEGAGLLSAEWVGNPHKATLGDNVVDVVYGSDMPTITVFPTKDGYTFDGAYDENGVKYYNADGTSAHIWDIDEDAELTIFWKVNQYTISFNSNGGDNVDAITADYNSAIVAPTAPTKSGLTFSGWFKDEQLTTEFVFDTMPAENITVYAKWIATAENVVDFINGIGKVEYTSESKALIDAANSAYAALDEDEKALVSNYMVLVQANEDYDSVAAAVAKVIAIGSLTPESKALLVGARADYSRLSPYQKSIYPADALIKLDDAEKACAALDKINDIGELENSAKSKEKIVKARQAYDALTIVQKSFVATPFVDRLKDAESAFAVIEKVNAIVKVEYTDDSKARLDEATSSYEKLTAKQKNLVPRIVVNTLETAENDYAAAKQSANSLLIIMIIVASILIASGIMLLILLFCKRRKQRKN